MNWAEELIVLGRDKPALTARIIEALIVCTGVALCELDATAGDRDSPWDADTRRAIRDADQWARQMREHRAACARVIEAAKTAAKAAAS